MRNRRKIKIEAFLGLLILATAVARAEPEPIPPADASDGQQVKKTPGGVQVKDTEDAKGGDTYNFYFQKSQGPNKVQQGNGSQAVEQQPAELPPAPPQKTGTPVVDLYAGLMFLPGKSATGVTFGGDFLPKSKVGVKLGFFFASGSKETQHNQSQTSIFDSTESTTKNELYGGDVAAAFNVVSSGKVKVAPLLGILLLNDKDTTTTRVVHFWGDNGTSSSNSHFRVYPYLGLSGTVSFSENFGLSGAVAVPTTPKFATTSLSFVWRI